MKLSVLSSFTLSLLTMQSFCRLITADEFEEITEKYCEAESMAEDRMVKVEYCYKLSPIDFLGLNPFSDCKKRLFTHGETDSQIRTALCSDDALDEKVRTIELTYLKGI